VFAIRANELAARWHRPVAVDVVDSVALVAPCEERLNWSSRSFRTLGVEWRLDWSISDARLAEFEATQEAARNYEEKLGREATSSAD
jgi:hypothetical protein